MWKYPEDKYLMLYASCIPVKGSRRSVICDLERERFDFIPNSLFDLLFNCKGKVLSDIVELYGLENKSVLEEYLDFLVDKEYIFFTESPTTFPELNLEWRTPYIITNAIVDFDVSSKHDITSIVSELNEIMCPAVQLRFYHSPSLTFLKKMLVAFERSAIRTVELLITYSEKFSYTNIESLMRLSPRLRYIKITSSPVDKSYTFNNYNPNIYFVTAKADSPACCGNVAISNFQVNIHLFTESQTKNSCLNGKISIDSKGYIKNCPTSINHFGKFGEVNLSSVIKLPKFKLNWNVNKDQISVCKDCEFRYICTDCRVLLSNPEDMFSKPLKCLYDPYTATWKKNSNAA